jgi:hypothetical protein
MVASFSSRRSTFLSVAALGLILLISVSLLYHDRVKEVIQPVLPTNHEAPQVYDSTPAEPPPLELEDEEFLNPAGKASTTATASTTASASTSSTDSAYESDVSIQTAPPAPTATNPLSDPLTNIQELCEVEGYGHTTKEAWKFDPAKDSANYGLDEEQCNSAFPDMYQEIERAKKWRETSGHGNITYEDLDLGWREFGVLRAMIYERQVCCPVLLSHGHGPRLGCSHQRSCLLSKQSVSKCTAVQAEPFDTTSDEPLPC